MFDAVIVGIPLVGVVIALTEMVKKLGVKDNWNILSSVVIGLVLGVGYQFSVAPLVGFAAWFNAVFYGLALGLTAAGLFGATKSATS